MSPAVTLSAQETVERLLPLLKEYAEKLDRIANRLPTLRENIRGWHGSNPPEAAPVEAARLLCLFDTLQKPITNLASHASGFLESSDIDHTIWTEMKLRLDELEEHLRFAKALTEELKTTLIADKRREAQVRQLVEKTGHKAPF